MKHPINTWSLQFVQSLRMKTVCVGRSATYAFTAHDRQLAIAKLQTLYPNGRIYPSFADRILLLSQIY